MRIDDFLCKLLSVGKDNSGLTETVKEDEIMALCFRAREVSVKLITVRHM